jgi:ubiquitin carboxyl-terminal hydrolase 4/11/15
MYLSLPLPIQKKIKIQVSFVPYDPSRRPVRLHLSLKKDAGIQHLKAQVAEQMNIENPNTVSPGYLSYCVTYRNTIEI